MIIEGEIEELCDDANIPVDIWLSYENLAWNLRASNYMPRRGRVSEEGIDIRATTREELAEIIKNQIIPLYETALKQLNLIVEGKAECLYYWKEDRDLPKDTPPPIPP